MSQGVAPLPGDAERNVAEQVQFERELRGWSTGELARRLTEAGCPISQSAIWRIENGEPRRKISVDELIGFSVVFDKKVENLLKPPRTEFPEEPVKEYVARWIDMERRVWSMELDASVAFSDIATMVDSYPETMRRLPDLVVDVIAEKEASYLEKKLLDRLKTMQTRLSSIRRSDRPRQLSRTGPIISYWKRIGLTRTEMLNEAKRLNFEGTLNGGMKSDIEAATRGECPVHGPQGRQDARPGQAKKRS